MDGVKEEAWGIRGMTMDTARQFAKYRKQWGALLNIQMIENDVTIFTWGPCVRLDSALAFWWFINGGGVERRYTMLF